MAKKAPSRKIDETSQDEIPGKDTDVKSKSIECGLVMPISKIDGCSARHWREVRTIIVEALTPSNLNVKLVSDKDSTSIIHSNIVVNLYENPIVICDVSCKNPNVMFELGLRLAFDMPTVVIKDDKTDYVFDTSPILHLVYPRDLNYLAITEFQKDLAKLVNATLENKDKPGYVTFLRTFKLKKMAKIETDVMEPIPYLQSELEEIKNMIRQQDSHKRPIKKIEKTKLEAMFENAMNDLKGDPTSQWYFDDEGVMQLRDLSQGDLENKLDDKFNES